MERGYEGAAGGLVSLFEKPETLQEPARGLSLPRRRLRLLLWIGLTLGVLAGAWAIGVHTWLVARLLSAYTGGMTFRMADGPNPRPATSAGGPYDQRLGYHQLTRTLERLESKGFRVAAQARVSDRFASARRLGFFPLYREKTQAGLQLLDGEGGVISPSLFPHLVYRDLDSVPPLVARTLLFLENRELLDAHDPHSNPAVEWDRFAAAVLNHAGGKLLGSDGRFGASTLATQLEKVRHSPGGVTASPTEKVRQMGSATLRSYLHGPRTDQVRRQILVDYLNALPMGALPGYGEVIGLRDGLRTWFGLDPDSAEAAIRAVTPNTVSDEGAYAYRASLGLLLAQRRPSYYLLRKDGRQALERLISAHLHVLANDSIIPDRLASLALRTQLVVLPHAPPLPDVPFVERKAVNSVRSHLLELLGVENLYQLDRLDLAVHATVDRAAQRAVTSRIRDLGRREFVELAGLNQERLLGTGDPSKVSYSFVLYEVTPQGNAVRVQVDNLDRPFDLNSGARLELGSTAKLRTLVTYLELVAGLHRALTTSAPDSGSRTANDPITVWSREFIRRHPEAPLRTVLDSAMQRTYSGSPAETFLTGGGVHTFQNFDSKFDDDVIPVAEGFRHSVNLVFVRLMRDIVRYHEARLPPLESIVTADTAISSRQALLERYADNDGRLLVERFFKRHRGKSRDEMLADLAGGAPSAERLTRVLRAVVPAATERDLADLLHRQFPGDSFPPEEVARLYQGVTPSLILVERGLLARAHPLEVWVAAWLWNRPEATLQEIQRHAFQSRQEAHGWLLRPTSDLTRAQDRALKIAREREAFKPIHAAWQRLGYPYNDMVPSLGTAIGSSGDRPGALAELVGILLSEGVRRPVVRADRLHFAKDTPFETVMVLDYQPGTRVLPPEIAAVARKALADVVREGTAGVLRGALVGPDSSEIVIGGKTGTGNNQFKFFARNGRQTGARQVSRTATFTFFLGERFYGVATAYVDGEAAAEFEFTSGLPVRLVKLLLPELAPLVLGRPRT